MILLIDNYDSFVYNLARYIGRLGRQREVVRNDALTLGEIRAMEPEAIILSPGPCTPRQSGICMQLIEAFHQQIPILGICLGHQCIGEIFGGQTVRAPKPVHGKVSMVTHDGQDIFMGMPNPMKGARYHSLITKLPANTDLEITAFLEDDPDIVMGMRHRFYPLYGLQFHPESILTEYGLDLIRNFMAIADEWNEHEKKRLASQKKSA